MHYNEKWKYYEQWERFLIKKVNQYHDYWSIERTE